MDLIAIGGTWIFGTALIYLLSSNKNDKDKLKIMTCRRSLRTIKKVDESDAKSIF